jgi:stage II sporulation protein D
LRLCLLGLVFLGGTLRAEVRVLLFQKELPRSIQVLSTARILSDGKDLGLAEEFSVDALNSQVVWRLKRGRSGGTKKLTLQPRGAPLRLRTPKGFTAIYDGELTVEIKKDRLRVINRVDEESYVRSAVGRELPADWPLEAVKAQAVLARTFLPANRARHESDGADVCDLTHCQAFGGRVSRAGIVRAVQETAGLILVQDGRPSYVFFHSDCGGHTAWARDVWPGGRSDLAGSPDGQGDRIYCADAPRHRWRAEISGLELALLLEVDESPSDMSVTSRDRSGRAARLRWGSREWTGEDLYLAWGRKRGWHELRSTRFTVDRKGNLFVFEGSGLGHGVGLCQYGARGRAHEGQGFREILRHYFPSADVRSRLPSDRF